MAAPSRPAVTSEIPGPRPLPLIGNALSVPSGRTIQSLMRLTRRYGPILRLHSPAGDRYVVSGLDMIDDICDDSRFTKLVGGGQLVLRSRFPSAGLFTADTGDPLWRSAHDILLPSFGTRSMRGYLPQMIDIAQQLMLKWERTNPGEPVDVTADTTRLTLDTIALCGFGYRFNSFYRETNHPFIDAMLGVLAESQTRSRIPPALVRLRRGAERRFTRNLRLMTDTVGAILDERRSSGDPGDDLLGRMLTGTDKQGRSLPDDNIVSQCITFLVAGHETTSGLLSFTISYLIKNPEVVARAQEEVDRVLGTDPEVMPTAEQLGRLTYVTQILDETLRLWPTAPAFTRQPLADDTVGGYPMARGTGIVALTPMLHRLPEVWGPDAEEFDPDHFAPERRDALPPNAFKPFGSGQRACIGRQFAMQEAVLVLGMLLQRFEMIDHAGYTLRIREALTLKPEGLTVTLRPRSGRTPGATAPPPPVRAAAPATAPQAGGDRHGTPLLVLFGSNLGTAEDLAGRLVRDGADRGYAARTAPLDSATRALPTTGAVVIVSASYNGTPPDNAAAFCAWLRDTGTPDGAAAGVRFTVFGCGNRDWASTYQAVPTLIDDRLAALGGTRVHPRGEGDARGDFDGQYAAWTAGLWDHLAAALDLRGQAGAAGTTGPRLRLDYENLRASAPVVRSYRSVPATVRANRELTSGEADRSVRHLEIELPAGTTYGTGDHLGVLPRNDAALVRRVLARFGLDPATYVTVTATGAAPTHLPTGEPYPVLAVLAGCVELQDPASRAGLAAVAAHLPAGPDRDALEGLTGTDDASRARYREQIALPRRSLLDVLEAYPASTLPFAEFLDVLPPLRPRYYSISSAPEASPNPSVTVGVLEAPARSGDGVHHGVCSTQLRDSEPGGTVFVLVREPSIPFRPPENPHRPMIMIGAGTGMAPFRGFCEERMALYERGVPVAESLLVLGCRDPLHDLLYAGELRAFTDAGVARLLPAYSRMPGHPHRYVQHVLAAEAETVWKVLEQDAVVYVCGNANTMAPAVREALVTLYRDRSEGTADEGDAWLAALRAEGRYLEDIWGESAVPG
ncbi:cytochrome P450 [Pseudonocardia sp. EC080610-09]|uniref:bifunctional cytochrome P450/NADPH--P450 reductase n=1 Tax=unclassified Pseudonocardia TaxID=2619320 RepID=UPI00070699B2|nr:MULTISPECIES: cytochrome P450 [unclassified Pseudonocardia]ALL77080.1 cytochrome P450 [Pseudonocardia sp. EC080610-09]ALL84111.1 cytochrome P450 [Pseudonocardia sp. EC080619-01]